MEFARRSAETKSRNYGRKYAKHYCLSDILVCPYCGGKYKRTQWKIGEQCKGVWRCGTRLEHGKKLCVKGASLHEDKLQRSILEVVNNMIENPERVETAIMETLEKYRIEIQIIDSKMAFVNAELENISARRDEILEVITGAVFEHFKEELKEMNGKELELKKELEQLQIQKDAVQFAVKKAVTARELFCNMLPLDEFDEKMIPKLVERIEVKSKTEIAVIFRGGVEVSNAVEK